VRGVLRTSTLATAAVAAAVAIYLLLTLPPATIQLTATLPRTIATGGFHIHTNRSDGTGTIDEIAAAAARAGLQFVVLTDHGDGTGPVEPASYRSGVLVIDAAEISTTEGHVVALGLTQPTPFPLAGPARDVVEDVHRFGGVAVAAHPDSPRFDLRWRPTRGVTVDGLEWLNVDSEWRDETSAHLFSVAVKALIRAPEAMASLLSRPSRTLERWDQALRLRTTFSVAALDAHARIPWRDDEEPRRQTVLARPSYEAMFKTVVQSVVLDAPLGGDPAADARSVLLALTGGHSYSVVRGLAFPASLQFSAVTDQDQRAQLSGDLHALTDTAETTITAAVAAAPGARVALLRNGREVASGRGSLQHHTNSAGAYRVEVTLPGAVVPWIVSNAIRVIGSDALSATGPAETRSEPDEWQSLPATSAPRMVERDPSSTATLANVDPAGTRFNFALGGGIPNGQYAAMVAPVSSDAGIDRVAFVGYADRPRRISVQFKIRGRAAQRWRHSVFLDPTPRPIVLRISDFEPADAGTSGRPNVVPLQSLLFVIDTVNSRPGTVGEIVVSDVQLGIDRLGGPAPTSAR
jgi:hypothetical protein